MRLACSAGCTEIAGPFEIQYEFSLATIRVKLRSDLQCSIAEVAIVVLYRRRLETRPFRRLLICTPVTDVRRLLTSITLVRLLVCTAITLLRRLLACIRTVRRLLVFIHVTRVRRLLIGIPTARVRGLLICTPSTRVRGLLTTVGENRVAPKVNGAGKRGWSRQNSRKGLGTAFPPSTQHDSSPSQGSLRWHPRAGWHL